MAINFMFILFYFLFNLILIAVDITYQNVYWFVINIYGWNCSHFSAI